MEVSCNGIRIGRLYISIVGAVDHRYVSVGSCAVISALSSELGSEAKPKQSGGGQ